MPTINLARFISESKGSGLGHKWARKRGATGAGEDAGGRWSRPTSATRCAGSRCGAELLELEAAEAAELGSAGAV